jgi:glutathione S-transferase
MTTLYGNDSWTSPYVLSAFVALREKGVPFDVVDIDLLAGVQHQPSFRDRSLTSRVPTLVDDDGFTLSESSAIVEYLEEKLAPPKHPRLLPERLEDRARARQLMAWVRTDLAPLRLERPTTCVFYAKADYPPLAPLGADAERAARKLLFVADRLIADGKTTLFADWSVADTDLALMLQRLVKSGYDVPAKVRKFADTQWERPATAEFANHPRPAYAPPLP